MPCQQSLRTSRKCMLHDVIWICLKTAKTPSNLEPKSTKRTVGLWNLRYPSPASGLPLAPDLLVTRILFKPLEGGASENEPSVERECSGKSGLAFTAMHGTYQALSSWYIYIEFLSTDEFFKSCAEISGSHHHHLPVHARRPGRPKEMLRMPILSSFWMCKNLAKSNPKSAVHPFPSNGNGRTVWIFGMPHSQMILHGVSRALGRDVGCLKPKKASCAELPAAKR